MDGAPENDPRLFAVGAFRDFFLGEADEGGGTVVIFFMDGGGGSWNFEFFLVLCRWGYQLM